MCHLKPRCTGKTLLSHRRSRGDYVPQVRQEVAIQFGKRRGDNRRLARSLRLPLLVGTITQSLFQVTVPGLLPRSQVVSSKASLATVSRRSKPLQNAFDWSGTKLHRLGLKRALREVEWVTIP